MKNRSFIKRDTYTGRGLYVKTNIHTFVQKWTDGRTHRQSYLYSW